MRGRYKDMKKLTAINLILLIFLLGQVMAQELFDIKAIDVLDNNYDTTKSIQNEKDLKSIELIWNNLVLIDAPPNNDWVYNNSVEQTA